MKRFRLFFLAASTAIAGKAHFGNADKTATAAALEALGILGFLPSLTSTLPTQEPS